jgi:hypothetical protein
MESREYLENVALKKSILPVFIYLIAVGGLFYLIDRVSVGANSFLGVDKLKVIQVLKAMLIGLLTTFLIFYLVYKYKFMEVNTQVNTIALVQQSPYPEIIFKLSDFSLAACSHPLLNILGYASNEIKNLTLTDLISTSSMSGLVSHFQDKNFVKNDFTNIHFIEKSKGILSLSVSLLKFDMLDADYVILRCYQTKLTPNYTVEENSAAGPMKRHFQF